MMTMLPPPRVSGAVRSFSGHLAYLVYAAAALVAVIGHGHGTVVAAAAATMDCTSFADGESLTESVNVSYVASPSSYCRNGDYVLISFQETDALGAGNTRAVVTASHGRFCSGSSGTALSSAAQVKCDHLSSESTYSTMAFITDLNTSNAETKLAWTIDISQQAITNVEFTVYTGLVYNTTTGVFTSDGSSSITYGKFTLGQAASACSETVVKSDVEGGTCEIIAEDLYEPWAPAYVIYAIAGVVAILSVCGFLIWYIRANSKRKVGAEDEDSEKPKSEMNPASNHAMQTQVEPIKLSEGSDSEDLDL